MGINGLSPEGAVAAVGGTIVSTSRTTDPRPSQERLCNDVLALRDIAFKPDTLRALALTLLSDDAGIPQGPAGDSARIALGELLRPYDEDRPSTRLPKSTATRRMPLEMLLRIADWPATATPYPRPAMLAELLGPEAKTKPHLDLDHVRALWRHHVRGVTLSGRESTSPYASDSMLRFAKAYLAEPPGKDPETFFQPFRQLARSWVSDIEPRQDGRAFFAAMGDALESRLVPYDRLRTWAEACAREYTPTPSGRIPVTQCYWEIALRALCSPMALGLLAHGTLELDTLVSWLGLDNGLHATPPVPHPPYANRLAYFLASPLVSNAACKASAIENPDVIPLLANSYMPVQHSATLLGSAGRMLWAGLEARIKEVVAQYAGTVPSLPKPTDPYKQRQWALRHYHDCFDADFNQRGSFATTPTNAADPRHVDRLRYRDSIFFIQSHARLYERIASLGLNRWSITAARRPDGVAVLHERFIPAKSLLSEWLAQGISADQQLLIIELMAQGFGPEQARRAVFDTHANSERLDAWFTLSGAADLSPYLSASMQEAVGRWLADADIPTHRICWIPILILCRLDTNRIEHILRSRSQASPIDQPLEDISLHPLHGIEEDVRNGWVTPSEAWTMFNQHGTQHETTARDRSGHDEISPLRGALRDSSEQLRRKLNQLDTAMAALPPDSPLLAKVDTFAQPWRRAIATLEDLLRPSLDDAVRERPEAVEARLLDLSADLNFAQPRLH